MLVVGGGPSGLAAAVGASRAGADVMLVEKFGCFGGVITTVGMETLGWYRSVLLLLLFVLFCFVLFCFIYFLLFYFIFFYFISSFHFIPFYSNFINFPSTPRYEGTVDCEGIGREFEKRGEAMQGGAVQWPYNGSPCLDADHFKVFFPLFFPLSLPPLDILFFVFCFLFFVFCFFVFCFCFLFLYFFLFILGDC